MKLSFRWLTVAAVASASALPAAAQAGGDGTIAGVASQADALGTHEVVIDGVRFWYEVAGAGPAGAPPVVFLHGGPGQGSHHFAELAGPELEPALRIVYYDQRGSGRSERPWTGEYSIERLVEDVEGLRRTLDVPRIALVGHSFGGTLALEYAARYPERVSAVVFVAGLWSMPVQCPLRVRTLAERRPEAYARVAADTLREDGSRRSDCELEFRAFGSAEEREAYNTEIMFPDPAVSARLDSVQAAGGIRNTGELGRALFSQGLLEYRFEGHDRLDLPVLVIAGRHDGAARSEGLRLLAERLPDGRFLELEGSGHFVYLDEPERFAREVTAFLGSPLP